MTTCEICGEQWDLSRGLDRVAKATHDARGQCAVPKERVSFDDSSRESGEMSKP